MMTTEHYDVLIIGGGIHGVGVAQAAAAAGYRVLLLEQDELASGTSSRSSKLIHGGLRYLEHGEISLVRECLRERALLLKNAPGLVHLRPFFIPVYVDSSRGRWRVAAGLALYSLLGGGGFHRPPRREWTDLDGLKTDGLRAVFQCQDAQTDDAALTRAVMASAQTLGAQLKTQASFVGASWVNNARGACWQVDYRQHGEPHSCTAATVVNAAGPWVNEVLTRFEAPPEPLAVELVQGSHLVLDGKLDRGIYYLESPRDQRPVFVMPWHGEGVEDDAILLGTTETRFTGNPAEVQPLPTEQDYLLETYRHYFSMAPPLRAAFAGLRVLPAGETRNGEKYASRQRETVLHTDDSAQPRLLTIYGGKLTAYRATAEKVMQILRKSLPVRAPCADTRTLKLAAVD